MTENLEELLDRVRSWPAALQEKAETLLRSLEDTEDSGVRLTDEQVKEVERRLADPSPHLLSAEQVKLRFLARDA